MQKRISRKIPALVAAISLLTLAGCANTTKLEERLTALETKVNKALQASAAARIDAATAMHMRTEEN